MMNIMYGRNRLKNLFFLLSWVYGFIKLQVYYNNSFTKIEKVFLDFLRFCGIMFLELNKGGLPCERFEEVV